MIIMQPYPPHATKLCHRKPGDVVQLHYNDDRPIDANYYIVTDPSHKTDDNSTMLVSLHDGTVIHTHTSTRCTPYSTARLAFGEG